MSSLSGRVKSTTRALCPVLPPKSAAKIVAGISELCTLLVYNQDITNSDRVEGKYTDFDITCDDGTVFKVHKLIVCPQVVAIDLALKKCFKVWTIVIAPFITDRRKEGQTNQYFLREQKSSVVSAFLDFVYGTSSDLLHSGDKVLLETGSVFLMAEVFALADQLQAERVFSYCLAWLKLIVPLCSDIGNGAVVGDVIDAMQYIHQNAHRTESIITYFISACVTAVTKTEGKHKLIIDWFRLAPEHNSNFLESLVTVSGNVLSKLFGENSSRDKSFDTIWAADGVDEIVVDGCSGGKHLQLSRLWEHDGFRGAVVEAGLLKKVSSALVEEALQLAESARAIADADRCIIDRETESIRFCIDCHSLLWSKIKTWERGVCCSGQHSSHRYSKPVRRIVELDTKGRQSRSIQVRQNE